MIKEKMLQNNVLNKKLIININFLSNTKYRQSQSNMFKIPLNLQAKANRGASTQLCNYVSAFNVRQFMSVPVSACLSWNLWG